MSIITKEQLKKQKIILVGSIIVYFLLVIIGLFILSHEYFSEASVLERFVSFSLVLLGFWIFGYGIRFIYLSIKAKLFGISFFLIVLSWLLSMAPFYYAVFKKFFS